mgnify:CR=1 FL=1
MLQLQGLCSRSSCRVGRQLLVHRWPVRLTVQYSTVIVGGDPKPRQPASQGLMRVLFAFLLRTEGAVLPPLAIIGSCSCIFCLQDSCGNFGLCVFGACAAESRWRCVPPAGKLVGSCSCTVGFAPFCVLCSSLKAAVFSSFWQ